MRFLTKTSWHDTEIDDDRLALLLEAGSDKEEHAGNRTLLDHLVGTYTLLKAWGAPKWIANAGLFHSIYGTEIFRSQCIPFTERERVVTAIGEKAEALVYLFCIMDRNKFMRHRSEVVDRNTGEAHAVSREDANNLMELLFANALEQEGPSSAAAVGLHEECQSMRDLVPSDAWQFYTRVFCAPGATGDGPWEVSAQRRDSNRPTASGYGERETRREAKRWEIWVTLHHDNRRIRVALPPVADYPSLQRYLCEQLGIDPDEKTILGLTEKLTGPLLPLGFIAREHPWRALPEVLYGVHVCDATDESRWTCGIPERGVAAAELPHPCVVEYADLLASLRRGSVDSVIQTLCDEVHRLGCIRIRVTAEEAEIFADTIRTGDEFFDRTESEKFQSTVDFDHQKFAGYARNPLREWLQVRTVFYKQDADRVYDKRFAFSCMHSLRTFCKLEAISRDVLTALCMGIGVPADDVLRLCDPPGLPPVMQQHAGVDRWGNTRRRCKDGVCRSAAEGGMEAMDVECSGGHDSMDVEDDSAVQWRRGVYDYPGSNVMRIFRYHTGDDEVYYKSSYPSSVHADIGFVTSAPASLNPALEIQSAVAQGLRNVEAEPTVPLRDVVVMVGETLGYLTRGYYRAPLHRVPPCYEKYRYSMPFFLRGHPDALIDPNTLAANNPILSKLVPEGHEMPCVSVRYLMDYVVQSRKFPAKCTDY